MYFSIASESISSIEARYDRLDTRDPDHDSPLLTQQSSIHVGEAVAQVFEDSFLIDHWPSTRLHKHLQDLHDAAGNTRLTVRVMAVLRHCC